MLLVTLLSTLIVGFFNSHHAVVAFTHCKLSVQQQGHQSIERTNLFALFDDDNDSNVNNDDDTDIFMSSLKDRIKSLQDKETKLPLVILDSMLPRQTLKVEIKNKSLQELVQHRLRVSENPTLGMLGKAMLANGDVICLNKGVEVEIFVKGEYLVEFKAKRRFRLEGEVDNTSQGWTEGRISYLCSEEEEANESLEKSISNAITKAKQIISPNFNLPNNVNMIERWIELAKQNEKHPGQISTLLEEIGDPPKENQPSELAFWIGSMINPLPAMGVAMEIRPALLMSESAEDRINIAYDGLFRSIKHMDGSKRMW